jgi:fumarate hydratase subunit alpha
MGCVNRKMNLINKVKEAVIMASTTFREDQIHAYRKALEIETNKQAYWILELLIQNARIAHKNKVPLCDDTGIPHVFVEVGRDASLPVNFIIQIKDGIKKGLNELPGRPMAVKGDGIDRIEQKKGLYADPSKVISPSFIIDEMTPGRNPEKVKIHILMLGGGPEIRGITYRVFHKRDHEKVFEEVINYMTSELPKLGCTPCIPAVGIGRTHFEASTLMLKAMIYGNLKEQSEIENKITQSINTSDIGALGMGGSVTALGSLVKIGPQRASGVRILCMRPCCCVEPRISSFNL